MDNRPILVAHRPEGKVRYDGNDKSNKKNPEMISSTKTGK